MRVTIVRQSVDTTLHLHKACDYCPAILRSDAHAHTASASSHADRRVIPVNILHSPGGDRPVKLFRQGMSELPSPRLVSGLFASSALGGAMFHTRAGTMRRTLRESSTCVRGTMSCHIARSRARCRGTTCAIRFASIVAIYTSQDLPSRINSAIDGESHFADDDIASGIVRSKARQNGPWRPRAAGQSPPALLLLLFRDKGPMALRGVGTPSSRDGKEPCRRVPPVGARRGQSATRSFRRHCLFDGATEKSPSEASLRARPRLFQNFDSREPPEISFPYCVLHLSREKSIYCHDRHRKELPRN